MVQPGVMVSCHPLLHMRESEGTLRWGPEVGRKERERARGRRERGGEREEKEGESEGGKGGVYKHRSINSCDPPFSIGGELLGSYDLLQRVSRLSPRYILSTTQQTASLTLLEISHNKVKKAKFGLIAQQDLTDLEVGCPGNDLL